jgi:hypothetical protein
MGGIADDYSVVPESPVSHGDNDDSEHGAPAVNVDDSSSRVEPESPDAPSAVPVEPDSDLTFDPFAALLVVAGSCS